jgi:hypothetical protein
MGNIRLELWQFEDTANGADIKPEQHASEASRSSHGECTPSVDF